MKRQKGFSTTLIIVIIAALVVLGLFLMSGKGTNLYNKGTQPTTQTQQSTTPAIQNNSALNAAASYLDNTDIDNIDTELNQTDAEAATF